MAIAWETIGTKGFGWAAALTGDFDFPHNSKSSEEINISSNTEWDELDYPNRIIQCKSLTIAESITLKLVGAPWFIFADEVTGAMSSVIDNNGPSGASSGSFDPSWCVGGTALFSSARAQGGCGGGLIIIVCKKMNFAGTISANGGNGYRNTTDSTSSSGTVGGQGCFSSFTTGAYVDFHYSPTTNYGENRNHPLGMYLGSGGGVYAAGRYGGSGVSRSNSAHGVSGGGSGIGGGGGASVGLSAMINSSFFSLAQLAVAGCKGGGGGGTEVFTSEIGGSNNAGSGGGGGGIGIAYEEDVALPTLSANGGAGSSQGFAGAAGQVAALQVVS